MHSDNTPKMQGSKLSLHNGIHVINKIDIVINKNDIRNRVRHVWIVPSDCSVGSCPLLEKLVEPDCVRAIVMTWVSPRISAITFVIGVHGVCS